MKIRLRLYAPFALLLAGTMLIAGSRPAWAQSQGAASFLPNPSGEGHGYTFGDSGLTLGGYAAAEAADFRQADAAANLRSLSLMLWWQGDSRWSFFSEVEGENLVKINGADSGPNHETDVGLERLHVDYAWSDALQFRIGKFLTPIGRWNVIHAAPLTWTTSRPLITESTFPTNATGAMVRGLLPIAGHALDWSVYASPGKELAAEDDVDPFREAYGLRLDYEVGYGLQLGASLVEFERKREGNGHKTLYGLDFLWLRHGFEVSGEWAYRARKRGGSEVDERGAYVQGVAPLYAPLYLVVRYERFNPFDSSEGLNLYIGGLAWRFRPDWVAKLEYRDAPDNGVGVPEGWLGSIAVLF